MFSTEFLQYAKIMQQFEDLAIDVVKHGFSTATHEPYVMQRPHRHNEVELNYLEAGSMIYLLGGRQAEVRAGSIAVFWAAIPHQLIRVDSETTLHWITIPFATFLQWQLPDLLTQSVIRGKLVQGDANITYQSSLPLFKQWREDLYENTPAHRRIVLLEVEAHLRRLALSIMNAQQSGERVATSSAQELSKVEFMACFIADHYTESLHVDTIARSVHLHPNYAMSLFHKHFGMSIVAYITQYRLAHAQRLLVMSNANASEVALEAGFGSVSRFYSAFKHAYGQAPGEYRAAWCPETIP